MELTLRDFGKILKKSWIILVIFTILGGLAGNLISEYLISKKYQASAMIIVSSIGSAAGADNSQMTINDYNLNTKLVNSYSVLCKSERILSQVKEKLSLNTDLKELSDMIDVSSQKDTDIIKIAVTDTSPQFAQSVANTLVDVFQEEVMKIMKMDNVQIIDYASLPTEPVSPNVMQNSVIGALIGFVLALIIAIIRYVMDDTVKNDDIITEIMGVPVIGNIPKFN